MGRAVKKLTAKGIAALNTPGCYGDGGGLWLRIFVNGSKRWIFAWQRNKQRRQMALGSLSSVSLTIARRKAEEARELLASGRDPLVAKREQEKAARATAEEARRKSAIPTFRAFSTAYIDRQMEVWTDLKYHQEWRSSLSNHAKNLLDLPVDAITRDDVLAALRPIWMTLSPTAGRLRGRIETILDSAKAARIIASPWENPARWQGNLRYLLPKQNRKFAVNHHAAVPYQDLPAFFRQLTLRATPAARALQLLILCATRTSETRFARWSEFSLPDRMWTIPGDRIKAGREHRIPLTESCMEILKTQAAVITPRPNAYVFPGWKPGRPLCERAMRTVMQRMEMGHFTVHGFRSSFRDYMGDMTDHQESVVEMALAHQVGDGTVRAYRRGDAFRKRTVMMADWENYLISRLAAGKEAASETEEKGARQTLPWSAEGTA